MSYPHLAQTLNSIDPALRDVILTIAQTTTVIDRTLQRGALSGALGSADQQNVQGETQKKLDIISNDLLIDALKGNSNVAALASEELDDFIMGQPQGRYLVVFDPLDGSSNIDINMCVGTIFSVLSVNSQHPVQTQDFYQSGRQQVAAGYVLYGPATMLVLTTGQGINMYTFDPDVQAFVLTQDQVRIPFDTQEFAINSSNQRHWEAPVKRYIDELQQGQIGTRAKDFNMRWVACMVGDIHRILTRGGIFLYPYDTKDPKKSGRLRLMYEANPMSWLIEQAGGVASTGRQMILDIMPHDLHQRVPVIMGSKHEVERVISYHSES